MYTVILHAEPDIPVIIGKSIYPVRIMMIPRTDILCKYAKYGLPLVFRDQLKKCFREIHLQCFFPDFPCKAVPGVCMRIHIGKVGLYVHNRGSISQIRAVHIGEGGFTEEDILVHDAHNDNIGLHMALADMKGPDYPVALGVIRDVRDITYDDGVRDQVKEVMAKSKIHCVDDLLRSGSTWEVE